MKSNLAGNWNEPFKLEPFVAASVADQLDQPVATPTWPPTYHPVQSKFVFTGALSGICGFASSLSATLAAMVVAATTTANRPATKLTDAPEGCLSHNVTLQRPSLDDTRSRYRGLVTQPKVPHWS